MLILSEYACEEDSVFRIFYRGKIKMEEECKKSNQWNRLEVIEERIS